MNIKKELESKLSSDYDSIFSLNDIRKIIDIDSILKDAGALRTGSHLELSCIRIVGDKSETKDEEFIYERNFYPGINTLISDNLKGKSSILKCIKFALTGKNSLKTDVSEWVNSILLEFKIGVTTYTSYIDNSGKRVKSTLYRASIEKYDEGNIREIDIIFSTASKDELERACENFFYKQLGVSSLKWTQKDSRKDVNKLHEAGTSWITFFKTIYLESKDSGTLVYGAQGDLLFQILLGLGLTSPMNDLKVRKEMLQFELSKLKEDDSAHKTDNREIISQLNSEIEVCEKKLTEQRKLLKDFDISGMVEELSLLVFEYQELEKKKVLDIKKFAEEEKYISKLLAEREDLELDLNKLESQKKKINKSMLRIEEHIEIGSFFSNLEINSCPSCNHSVEVIDYQSSNVSSCNLCHHEITSSDRLEDVSRLEAKVATLRLEANKIDEQALIIERTKAEVNEQVGKAEKSRITFDVASEEDSMKQLLESINSIEKKIENSQDANKSEVNTIRDIEAKIAVLKYRVKEAEATVDGGSRNVEKSRSQNEINLLDSSIEYLKQYRSTVNNTIIDEFKEIIISVLHSLGLESFSEIEIDTNLRISYIQGGNKLYYSDITEGEQLRVKIALYLALVRLSSEHGVGNHPRLLIIDSPGKEEADDKYFDGLIDSLNTVENHFSDQIQILIGTADRRLAGIVANKKQEIRAKDEAFF